jgi:hypothetical protein
MDESFTREELGPYAVIELHFAMLTGKIGPFSSARHKWQTDQVRSTSPNSPLDRSMMIGWGSDCRNFYDMRSFAGGE